MLRARSLYIGERRSFRTHIKSLSSAAELAAFATTERFSGKWMLFLRAKEEKQKFGFFIFV